jgi:hypothetical protein
MKLKLVSSNGFNPGDLVTVKNMPREEHFCIIAIKKGVNGQPIAKLKALFNDTYIIEKPVTELESLLIRGKL